MPVSHRAEINIDEMIASNNEATEAEEWSRKIAVCTGLDGFHFSRNYLDGFPVSSFSLSSSSLLFSDCSLLNSGS